MERGVNMELQLTLIIVILILLVLFLALILTNYMQKAARYEKLYGIFFSDNDAKLKKIMSYDRITMMKFNMTTDDFMDMLEHIMVDDRDCVVTTQARLMELEEYKIKHDYVIRDLEMLQQDIQKYAGRTPQELINALATNTHKIIEVPQTIKGHDIVKPKRYV